MFTKLLRTKPVEQHANSGLKRCLGVFDLTLLGIGAIIGTGYFCFDWLCCSPPCWSCGDFIFCLGRHQLRLCRAILCGNVCYCRRVWQCLWL